ncbi:MAG: hypothetical protein MJY52_05795 [Bacteroidaceae bacterium]|nr:hypothetical protein [Bacteroidaceae bacterium]
MTDTSLSSVVDGRDISLTAPLSPAATSAPPLAYIRYRSGPCPLTWG